MVSQPIELRQISNEEGNRLLRMVRRGAGNVVTWRRAQIVLWAAQGYRVSRIAEIGFTSEDRVREVIHNFNADGFESLSPKYGGGRPAKFDASTRSEIARIALTRPKTLGRPYTRWSLAKLCDYLVAAGIVEDISIESVRRILDEEGVSFQRLKTWKDSNDPFYEEKKELIWALTHDPPPDTGSSRSTSSDRSPVSPSRDGDGHRGAIPVGGEGTITRPKGWRTGWGSTTWPPTTCMAATHIANASLRSSDCCERSAASSRASS
jgi:transposase